MRATQPDPVTPRRFPHAPVEMTIRALSGVFAVADADAGQYLHRTFSPLGPLQQTFHRAIRAAHSSRAITSESRLLLSPAAAVSGCLPEQSSAETAAVAVSALRRRLRMRSSVVRTR